MAELNKHESADNADDDSPGIEEVRKRIERARLEKALPVSLLNLSELSLGTLPPEIGDLTTLIRLDLRDNQLTTLPPEIGRLIALAILDLQRNQLTTLPPEIGHLKTLVRLCLHNNQLTTLPPEIGQLATLKGLDLISNRLTTLPSEIGRLTDLSTLYLAYNQLTSLPSEIGHLTALSLLNLQSNQLTMLPPEIGQFKALSRLYLSDNQLTTLPPEIGQLTTLKGLDLPGNRLTTLPSEIGQITTLEELDLSSNQLTTLPSEIGQLKALRRLNLHNNQLTTLPESLRALPKLESLYLHGNPALGMPEEILGPSSTNIKLGTTPKPPREILDYYFGDKKRAMAHGTQPLNEAKVIVLGEAEVGKSSLILALTESKLKQPLGKTHGIVQKPWSVPLRAGRLAPENDEGDESLRLNLWDFGGQEVYHATHTFFLTRRAVYLLVADARANDRQNNLEYWLQMAASFGADAPVWIAVNKCDQHGDGPDEHALKRKFPNIRGFLRTSCWTGDGITLVKEKLVVEALSLDGVRHPMNKIWLAIKHALEGMTADTITLEDYRALCLKHEEKEPGMPDKLLDLWDTLGTVRYFPERPDDPPEMRDSAILNPEWVTKAVYAVLDDQAVRYSGGLAVDEDFQRILKKSGYATGRAKMIEQVMRRFDLLFDTPDFKPQHKMLVPQLLPEREPEHAWPTTGTLEFVYRYSVLPAGLMPTFIARSHRKLSKEPGPWRHGCVLDFPNGARARVIGDTEQKQVTLSVTGDPMAARDALDAVRSTFEDMHAVVQGLAVEELIPVPGRPDAPMLNYRHLRALELNGRSKFDAQGATPSEIIEIDVREALNAVRGKHRAEVEHQQVITNHFHAPHAKPTFTTGDMNQDDHSIHIGGNVINAQVGQTLTNCTNMIQQQAAGPTKDLLEQLQNQVQDLLEKLPEEKRAEVTGDLEQIIKGATANPPVRRWYSVSSEGLMDAAKYVNTFTKEIAGTLKNLGTSLWPDFKLPGS